MESVGLALGAVGLAGLFTSCLECFELVKRGSYLGRDYLLLETKFANQRLRLATWGQACGFTDPAGYDERLDADDNLKSCLQSSLVHIVALFRDGKDLRRKYGLRCVNSAAQEGNTMALLSSSQVNASVAGFKTAGLILGQRLLDLSERVVSTQKNAKLSDTTRWAIHDRQKFTELVQHLKDLIDDLETLTTPLGILDRQRREIRHEVESIFEIPMLEMIEEARMGTLDPVSDAASFRLWSVRDRLEQPSNVEEPPSQVSGAEDAARATTVRDPRQPAVEEEWETFSDDRPDETLAADVKYQVLHRITCCCEPTAIYFDAPKHNAASQNDCDWAVLDADRPSRDPTSLHLCGRRILPNLDAYLTQNPQLVFVVLRNYVCEHAIEQQSSDNGVPVEIDPTSQSVYLVSMDLCLSLTALADKASPSPDFPNFGPEQGWLSEADYHQQEAYQEACQEAGMWINDADEHEDMYNDMYDDDPESIYFREGENGYYDVALKPAPLKFPELKPGTELHSPYLWFFHHQHELTRVARQLKEDEQSNPTTLLQFIESSMSEEYSRVKEQLAKDKISWEYCQYAFPTGKFVVQLGPSSIDYAQAYEILGEPTIVKDKERGQRLEFEAFSWAYDGSLYRVTSKFQILRDNFAEGRQPTPLTDLPVVPLSAISSNLSYDLYSRGRKLWRSWRNRVVTYTGSGPDAGEYFNPTRFIIDPGLRKHQGAKQDRRHHDRLGQHILEMSTEPCNRMLCLLPPTVHGFHLHKRRWHDLWVSQLGDPISWDETLFKNLVTLSEDSKSTIVTLGETVIPELRSGPRITSSNLILFLYGKEGTGKTYAATAIAEHLKKPLYQVDAASLPKTAEALEEEWDTIQEHVLAWNCLFLIENINVGLESSLVTVFTRQLSHFKGVLVMTSCRSDDEYNSRTLLSNVTALFHLNGPTLEMRRAVWCNLVDTQPDLGFRNLLKAATPKITPKDINGLAQLNLTLRSISDVVTAAECFGSTHLGGLCLEHVHRALRMKFPDNRGIDTYLKSRAEADETQDK